MTKPLALTALLAMVAGSFTFSVSLDTVQFHHVMLALGAGVGAVHGTFKLLDYLRSRRNRRDDDGL